MTHGSNSDIFAVVRHMLDYAAGSAHFREPVTRAAAIILGAIGREAGPRSVPRADQRSGRSASRRVRGIEQSSESRANGRDEAAGIEPAVERPSRLAGGRTPAATSEHGRDGGERPAPIFVPPALSLSERQAELVALLSRAAPAPVDRAHLVRKVYAGLRAPVADELLSHDVRELCAAGHAISDVRGVGVSLQGAAA